MIEYSMPSRQKTPDIPGAITECLARSLRPSAVFLFGSHARGASTPDSDWDFLVVVPESTLPPYRRAQEARRSVRHIHVPKDIIVMTASEWRAQRMVPVSLVNTVRAEGRLLYGGC